MDNQHINMSKSLIFQNGECPKIYELLKIHKENYLLRSVVSTIVSAVYNMAYFIAGLLKPLSAQSCNTLKILSLLLTKLKL